MLGFLICLFMSFKSSSLTNARNVHPSVRDWNPVFTAQLTHNRKLDGINLAEGAWNAMGVTIDIESSNSLLSSNSWAISISSNETILSNGNCSLFNNYSCSSPDCYNNASEVFSRNYPSFSSTEITRLNLTNQSIALGNSEWELNSSPLYLHNCNYPDQMNNSGNLRGVIGLGLDGQAKLNFPTANPVFSIFLTNSSSGKLVFEFNLSYAQDLNAVASLPSNANWEMSVKSITIGNSTFPNASIPMIFDLQFSGIYISSAYYLSLKTFFFDLFSPSNCTDQNTSFVCVYSGELADLPSLIFNLENGTNFSLPPAVYIIKSLEGYSVEFFLYDTTFSLTEFIVLGTQVMSQYYLLFQQIDQNNAISLYLFAGLSTKNPSNSSISTSESNHVAISDEDDTKSRKINVFLIVGVVLAIVILVSLVFIGFKTGWFQRKKDNNQYRETLELNDHSYFTSARVTVIS